MKLILDSTIAELQQNKDRTFVYVEMAFFSRWWNEQSKDVKKSVKELVFNGQLEFANGGWCMHDEAGLDFFPPFLLQF